MSNSASISAAKKRRGVPAQQQQQPKFSQSRANIQEEPKVFTPQQLLGLHDRKIFCLEKKFEEYTSSNSINSLERMHLEKASSPNLNNNRITKQIKENSSEVSTIKKKGLLLDRTLKEYNGSIVTMRATILSHEQEINNLKELVSEMKVSINAKVEAAQFGSVVSLAGVDAASNTDAVSHANTDTDADPDADPDADTTSNTSEADDAGGADEDILGIRVNNNNKVTLEIREK